MAGNLVVVTGAGDDTVKNGGAGMMVGKNVTLQLGDGANTIYASLSSSGKKYVVSTGSGVDSVGLFGTASNAALTVSLGANDDEYNNTLINTVSLRADGGAGTDHFSVTTVYGNPVAILGFEDFS